MKKKRWEIVLKYIVEDFIQTAQPVGSKSLLKKHKLQYSSATIRNEMMHLEKLGYIEKTHTSSGRIPSVNGYRYYVSNLRDERVDKSIKYEIDNLVDNSTSLEDLLIDSCKLVSNMTNLASCFLGPNLFEEKIVRVEIVNLEGNKFSFLFITNKGYLENKTFILPRNGSMKRLIECSKLFEEEIKGTELMNLFDKIESVKDKFEKYEIEFSYINQLLVSTLKDFLTKRNSQFFGKDNLLNQPEFKDNIEESRYLMNLLSKPYKLNGLFDSDEETVVSIGSGDLKDISIITKNIKTKDQNLDLGKIAVVGPIRMDYDTVLKYLDYVSDMVIEHIDSLERR